MNVKAHPIRFLFLVALVLSACATTASPPPVAVPPVIVATANCSADKVVAALPAIIGDVRGALKTKAYEAAIDGLLSRASAEVIACAVDAVAHPVESSSVAALSASGSTVPSMTPPPMRDVAAEHGEAWLSAHGVLVK